MSRLVTGRASIGRERSKRFLRQAAGQSPRYRRSIGRVAVDGRGILDYPHYTRPQSFRGWDVPEMLMSGNHEEIRRWRREEGARKNAAQPA